MFSILKNRLGIPGIISVIALAFAMSGGAFAAQHYLAKKASKKSNRGPRGPKGPKGPKGNQGPIGPQGPVGPAGPNGADGKAGVDGENGKAGQSVTSISFGVGEEEAHCPAGQGGTKFISASGTTYACNGKIGEDGEPGEPGQPRVPDNTLPSEATETGAWDIRARNVAVLGFVATAISFPIPLVAPLDEEHTKVIEPAGIPPAECDNGVAPAPSVANPEATPGYLCVFAGVSDRSVSVRLPDGSGTGGAGTSGARVGMLNGFGESTELKASGTFAVTAP